MGQLIDPTRQSGYCSEKSNGKCLINLCLLCIAFDDIIVIKHEAVLAESAFFKATAWVHETEPPRARLGTSRRFSLPQCKEGCTIATQFPDVRPSSDFSGAFPFHKRPHCPMAWAPQLPLHKEQGFHRAQGSRKRGCLRLRINKLGTISYKSHLTKAAVLKASSESVPDASPPPQ